MHAYEISADPERLDFGAMHAYLTRSYWSAGIALETVVHAARHSLCFGAYQTASGAQVGLARVVTDHATFAYLCDVYVLEDHRQHGLGQRLVAAVMGHPAVAGARRALLATRDAHGLYRKFGFADVGEPARVLMQVVRPDIYRQSAQT